MKRLTLFALAWFACAQLHAGLFNTNLIVNGDAEAGPGSLTGNDVLAIPGWTSTNRMTVTIYGVASDIPTNAPGPAHRGTNLFTGGPANALSSAFQMIDLTSVAAAIDSGSVLMELTGYLGGWSSQDDASVCKVEFFNGITTNALSQASIGPVTAADRTNVTALQFRGATNTVPDGARLAKVTLTMTRAAGSYNDGNADNLSFVLTTGRPALTIRRGANPVISWPAAAGDWRLQAATRLSDTPSWTDIFPPYQTNAGQVQFVEPTPTGSRFYRLRSP